MNIDYFMFHKVVPASVLGVVALGFAQSLWMVLYKPWSHTSNGAWAAKAYEVSGCAAGPPQILLVYRVLAVLWNGYISVAQFRRVGVLVLKYYTVWNYSLLVFFFALAALYSILDVQRQKADKRSRRAVGEKRVNALGYYVVTLFHINLTTVLIVDTLTWCLLWPMLKLNPDSSKIEFFSNQLFNFTSYNQHGLNFFWMLGEAFLNRIPFYPYLLGYVGIWTSAYGVWAFANFSSTGKWMYPFLDADKPWAPFAYFGLFLVHWVFFGFVILLLQLKYWLWKKVPSSRQHKEIQMAKRQ